MSLHDKLAGHAIAKGINKKQKIILYILIGVIIFMCLIFQIPVFRLILEIIVVSIIGFIAFLLAGKKKGS